jgi:hypothetical protein
MKIGIDGTDLALPFPCGTRTYARSLLFTLADADKKNEYFVFAPRHIQIPKRKNFHVILYPKALPVFNRQLLLPLAVRKEKVDIFHHLVPFGTIFFRSTKNVTTVNDINLEIIFPKYRNIMYFLHRYYYEIIRYFFVKRSDNFIAISDFTARELRRYLINHRIFGKNITTIYDAASDDFKRITTLKQNYFLCLGDFSPRKNLNVVFEAFSMLPEKVKSKYYLHVVISTKKEMLRFKGIIRKYDISGRVKLSIGISNRELCKLYNRAQALIYPSLYEGFGLPILEAMKCGCPVITSNFGAMKEISGQAALHIDPKQANGICRAMLRIINNKILCDNLTKLGIMRAKEFSWVKTAKETIKVYERVARER